MSLRRGLIRQLRPWFVLLILAGGTTLVVRQAFTDPDPVVTAQSLLRGDPQHGVPKDPRGCIELLNRFLARHPGHYEALRVRAQAWADLHAWGLAVQDLEQAFEHATSAVQKLTAKTRQQKFLLMAERYEQAVEVGREVVALQPTNPVRELQVGTTYYGGSVKSQQNVVHRFTSSTKDERSLEIEEAIEAYITNIWGNPDVGELVHWLMPNADPVVYEEVHSELSAARRGFLSASKILGAYRDFGGFDAMSAQAYAELLLRSGRVYDAHIEAGMALREPKLTLGYQRDLLEIQANCSLAVEDPASAADTYGRIIELHESAGLPALAHTVRELYEARVEAGHYDWILEHVDQAVRRYGDDPVLRYARAVALHAAGRPTEAVEGIVELFTTLSMGAQALWPPSFRSHPERRRLFLKLAYSLFDELDDPRAATALDAILQGFPKDAAARLLRINRDLATASDDLQQMVGTENDAFLLLTRDRRDRADFRLWLDVADRLSLVRHGLSLSERAAAAVREAERWTARALEAELTTPSRGRGGKQARRVPVQLFWADDPAMTYTVVEELARRNSLERARVELRKLVDAYPDLQEFRHRLGFILVREGRLEAASAEFRKLLTDVPSDTETLDLTMRCDYALGRYGEANELVNRMILLDPLGVGAVRYGLGLLEGGRPDQALRLVERLVRWTEFATRKEILILAARAHLALGNDDSVEATLKTLTALYPDAVDVAVLGLDYGILRDRANLVQAAVQLLHPLVIDLLPDQMRAVPEKLVNAGLYEEALDLFDEDLRALPAAAPALRLLLRASVATGALEDADALLTRIDDPDSLVDQFILLAMQGRVDEAGRRVRQRVALTEGKQTGELCLLLASVLRDHEALPDPTPLLRLRQLGVDTWLEEPEVELLDALLRLRPLLSRLSEVRPVSVVQDPEATYPNTGGDVAMLLTLARADPRQAGEVMDGLLLLLLAGERPLWARSSVFLAHWALRHVPDLLLPSLVLARHNIAQDQPAQAIEWIQSALQKKEPDVRALRLFLEATRMLGHAEWGMALAMTQAQRDPVALLVGETLAQRSHAAESVLFYRAHLSRNPSSARSLGGLIAALSASGQHTAVIPRIGEARQRHPDDADLASICARALGAIPRPTPNAVKLMDELYTRFPDLHIVGEARIRAHRDDPERLVECLETYLERMEAAPIPQGDRGEIRHRVLLLGRAAHTASTYGHIPLARRLHQLALRLAPGSATHLRPLAFLELEAGNLEVARKYLEVLSFIDLNDRDAAMALARLYFLQLGQPVQAARIIERTIRGTPPPAGVEILAARAYLLGNPQRAIEEFRRIELHPLVTEETYMTIARIAYASHQDDIARPLITMVLSRPQLGPDHPLRSRAEHMATILEPGPAAPGKP